MPTMRLDIRETGSIRVPADKERVLEILRAHLRDAAIRGDRIDTSTGAYVVRAASDGTRIYHSRHEKAPVTLAGRDRETLRRAVQADLYELRRVLELNPR